MISLIIPCYNIENVCKMFFDSLIKQTYTDIELIFVNDGSTDNTEEVLLSYKKVLEELGYKFIYIFQKNKGLGGAINTGLKCFTGDYLCWADPDDYFSFDSFEKKLKFMETNKECNVLCSDAAFGPPYENIDIARKLSEMYPHSKEKEQFELILSSKTMLCSGCYMLRSNVFLEVNPNRNIYPCRRGQNQQMLMPMLYSNKWYFLDEPLYFYTILGNSMSHENNSFENNLSRFQEKEDVMKETVDRMLISNEEKAVINKKIDKYISVDKLIIYKKHKHIKLFVKEYLKALLKGYMSIKRAIAILLR